MKKGISTAVLLSALLLLTLAAVFLLQCFLGGMLFDWNYREPLQDIGGSGAQCPAFCKGRYQ